MTHPRIPRVSVWAFLVTACLMQPQAQPDTSTQTPDTVTVDTAATVGTAAALDSTPVADSTTTEPAASVTSDTVATSDSSSTAPTSPDTLSPDSLRGSRARSRTTPAPDSLSLLVEARRWGVGVGWSLGGFDLYSLWEQGLPDSLGHFLVSTPIAPWDYGMSPSDTDSIAVRYVSREPPDAYNVQFPIYVSFVPYTRKDRHLTIEAGALFARKAYQASIRADSIGYRLDIRQSLIFYSACLGLTYSHAVPTTYFSIDKAGATYASVGVALHPLSSLNLSTSLNYPDGEPDSVDAYSRSVKRKVLNRLPEITAFGLGVSWRAGLYSLSLLGEARGLQVGVFYVGKYFRSFSSDGDGLTRFDIEHRTKDGGEPLSFYVHQVEIRADLLLGRRKKQAEKSP